jgi:hypothetical protein
MTVPLNSLLKDCLLALHSLQAATEQLPQRSFKRLCERTEIFLPTLKSLEDSTVATQNDAEFAGLKNLLQSFKKLLSEIQDFFALYVQDSSLSITRRMALNNEFRSKRAEEISSFNARILELRSVLLPAVGGSVEKNCEEDLEDLQLDMEESLAAMLEELKGLRTNPAELKRCLQVMKQDCCEGQTEIFNKLSEVEAIFDANHHVSVMDLVGIEQAIYNQLSAFPASLKNKSKG